MSSKSLNISGKLDQAHLAAYRAVVEATTNLNIPFFVIGASARDLVFEHGYGIRTPRATLDMDIAVQVSNWGEFEALRKNLLGTTRFSETNIAHRLKFENAILVDIVPFGGIAGAEHALSWPDEATRMNVLGFDEACAAAMRVHLAEQPVLEVPTASPQILIVLKSIAWSDRAPGNTRDASDLAFLLRHYLDVGNDERLYQRHADLLDEDFDYIITGARLAGRDVADVFSEETTRFIKALMNAQIADPDASMLIQDMTGKEGHEKFEENKRLIEALLRGLND